MKAFNTKQLLAAAGIVALGIVSPVYAVDITDSVINPSFELGVTPAAPGDDNRLGDTQNGWYNWAAIQHGMHWWQPSDTDRSSLQRNEYFDTGFGGVIPDGNIVLAIRTQSYDYNEYGGSSSFDEFTYADSFGNRQFNPGYNGTTVDGTFYDWALDDGASNALGYYTGGSRDRQSAVGMTVENFDSTARYILSVQVGRLPEGTGPNYDGSGLNAGLVTATNDNSTRFINDAPAQWGGYAVEMLAGAADGSTLSRLTDDPGGASNIWIYSNSTDINDANHIATIASDENGVAIAENTWGTSTIEYTPGVSGDFAALDGKAFMIRLSGLELADHRETTAAAFDDVKLIKIYAGDANEDDRVDLNDGSTLVANFNTGGGKTWATGDFTGDGVVDLNDGGLLVGNFGFDGTTPAAANSLSLEAAIAGDANAQWTYDDVVNGLTATISIEAISQAFLSTEALDGAILELTQQAVPFSTAQAGPGTQVGEFLTSNFITGTELIDVTVDSLGTYTFEARWNVVGGTEQSQTFEITFVPEPNSLALLGVCGLLLARRRRD